MTLESLEVNTCTSSGFCHKYVHVYLRRDQLVWAQLHTWIGLSFCWYVPDCLSAFVCFIFSDRKPTLKTPYGNFLHTYLKVFRSCWPERDMPLNVCWAWEHVNYMLFSGCHFFKCHTRTHACTHTRTHTCTHTHTHTQTHVYAHTSLDPLDKH